MHRPAPEHLRSGGGTVIRPSRLGLARYCEMAPALAEQYPNRNENTDTGNSVDAESTADLAGTKAAESADAKAIVSWMREKFGKEHWRCWVQTKVALTDSEWGTVITEGTPDFQAADTRNNPIVVTVDFKKREQYAAGLLSDPDENDQCHAYSIARCEIEGIGMYRNCLLLFGDGEVEPLWSRPFQAFGPVRREIEEICAREPKDIFSAKAVSGPHCLRCYPRVHCPAWQHRAEWLRSKMANGIEITKENRTQILAGWLAMKDMIEPIGEQLKATVQEWGPILLGEGKVWKSITMRGKASADVPAIRAAMAEKGLNYDDYVKKGGPYSQFRIGKAK